MAFPKSISEAITQVTAFFKPYTEKVIETFQQTNKRWDKAMAEKDIGKKYLEMVAIKNIALENLIKISKKMPSLSHENQLKIKQNVHFSSLHGAVEERIKVIEETASAEQIVYSIAAGEIMSPYKPGYALRQRVLDAFKKKPITSQQKTKKASVKKTSKKVISKK